MKTIAMIAGMLCAAVCVISADEQEPTRQIGVARVDITPAFPIRLSGYAVRKTESTNVVQKLWAKALVIGSDKEKPVILITVDNTGVPKHVRDEVVARLARKKIEPANVTISSTHTHTAPYLDGYLPTLFGEPLPAEHQAHVQRYTRELTDAIEKAALDALKNRKPGRLAWGQGRAGFAANRRTKGGPVDHDLPMIAVSDSKGKLRALLVNYACHCTTVDPKDNAVCGDWAGYAQEFLERDHPGVTVLVAIGCGADANPAPRTGLNFAQQHGGEIATNINELLQRKLKPIRGKLVAHAKEIAIPLDKVPTRAELEERAKKNDYIGFHARYNLEKLNRGEALAEKIPYLVQTWNFGEDLALVFLPGEVVVDYSLRLKKEFDPARLWVTAYANDVPCYIPSERILQEGGYEGGGAMTYYGWPTRIAPGVEKLIIDTVHELLPKKFLFNEKEALFPLPKSPEEALEAFEAKPGFEIQLVASEPLVVDPVAIDWDAEGNLWVAEMRDYPTGMDGNWKAGSRVKVLQDTNGDGKYDKATVVMDEIPFVTGVTAWREGALVSAAPDIFYVKKNFVADEQSGSRATAQKIFSGFVTENYQARVNSLSLGLDNWIYGANGLLGGTIHGVAEGREVDIRGRDFRMNPDSGAFEPVSGLTQQGRARDDWGNWFGCDNSTLAWHFPIPDHYVRRNPHVPAPAPRVSIARGDDPNRLFPISRALERFNHPESANRATSVCGLGVYRDSLFGPEYEQNLFVCESVHNLVRRLVLKRDGATFSAVRAPDEQHREFLASHDNWFRPVQARTGPDGALYVVDMYRFLIEHPRWISPERLAQLDVRAGADKGRIYRVVPKGTKISKPKNFRRLSTRELVAALDTANGTVRDLVHLELTQRGDRSAVRPLEKLAASSALPAVRLQALCVLDGMQALSPDLLVRALADSHFAVRANAVRLSEQFFSGATSQLTSTLLKLVDDSDFSARYQLALSLGEWNDRRAGEALAKLAARDMQNNWMRAAIVSSATHHSAEILESVLAADANAAGRNELISLLIATAAGEGDSDSLKKIIGLIAPANNRREDWQLSALSSLLETLDRKKNSLASLGSDVRRLAPLFNWAGEIAMTDARPALRTAAIRLLGRNPDSADVDLKLLIKLVDQPDAAPVQAAVLDTLKRIRKPELAGLLLENWPRRAPAQRQACVEILLSRDDGAAELLRAIEQNVVMPGEISIEGRQRLLAHRNLEIQNRAKELFKPGGNRAEILARYEHVSTLPGDAARGAEVFAKNCATCHALRGQGHDVGPNLAALADKSVGDWLLAILDPNAIVEPRFVAYNIETKDDRSLSGIVSAETATTITLVQSGGLEEKILRNDIASIRASGVSLMPEGLEQAISPQEMADVIAFVRTSPRLFGSATPEQAAGARTEFLRGGMNGLAKVIAASERIEYPSRLGVLPFAHCRQTDGQSRVVWESAPVAAELKSDAMMEFRLPAGMGFFSQPSGKFDLRINGRHALSFDVVLTDKTWRNADGAVEMSYTVMENNSEDANGVLLMKVKGQWLEPGRPATFEVVGSAANSMRWFGIYLAAERKLTAAGLPQNSALIDIVVDDAAPAKEREAVINAHRELSGDFLQALTADLKNSENEYRRIPWIWRVTVAAGKRNDAAEVLNILKLSLPKMNEPLRDWQAVVIGGGIINGIGLSGGWPKERVEEILSAHPDLLARWHRANDLAAAMAGDEKVKTGTRYDALRMMAMVSWEKRGEQLKKYLAPGVNAELQQGAISGLSDMKAPEVAAALLSGLGHYSKSNREFALDALLRDESRVRVLLNAMAAGKISATDLGEQRVERLRNLEDEKLAEQFRKLVAK